MKEEQVLFPMARQLERSSQLPTFHCGSVGNPVRVMEREHDDAGEALRRLRSLTDGYRAPDDACHSYRSLLGGFEELEHDLHLHIHKENNLLHPRILARERLLGGT